MYKYSVVFYRMNKQAINHNKLSE